MRLFLSNIAKADIREIVRTTRVEFGPLQVPEYRALISEARKRVRENPNLGHHREGLPPDWRLLHISQRGRPADVLRVLHDAMDVPRHWPERPR